MAIKRQVENPGQSLVIDEPIKYSIKSTLKKSLPKSSASPATALHTVESVKKDLRYTFFVFLGILVILIALYIKS